MPTNRDATLKFNNFCNGAIVEFVGGELIRVRDGSSLARQNYSGCYLIEEPTD
jgi:hypothetical protein